MKNKKRASSRDSACFSHGPVRLEDIPYWRGACDAFGKGRQTTLVHASTPADPSLPTDTAAAAVTDFYLLLLLLFGLIDHSLCARKQQDQLWEVHNLLSLIHIQMRVIQESARLPSPLDLVYEATKDR